MKLSAFALAAALGVVPALAAAQAAAPAAPSANPVSDALRMNARRYARTLTAAAEMFPQDKYVYKPTDAQMSVGDIVVHLIEGNDMLCGTLGGTPAPQRTALTASAPKDQLLARLRETFQFCDQALANVTDAKMGDQVPSFGGRTVPRANMVLITIGDWADHYSQLAIYLRLNNMLPPTARQQGGE
ncbi:MAG: DinB family protein [Gemmatimonadales bacterium]|jgi:uncharacterized damage-inducible protein DinB